MPKRSPHRNFQRRPSRRSPKARVLVVCEGERSEPFYFKAMRDRLRLNTLVVKAAKGVDPRTLVQTHGTRRLARGTSLASGRHAISNVEAEEHEQRSTEQHSANRAKCFVLHPVQPCWCQVVPCNDN